jgi:DNA-directed RNA polymerase specialized sigma24 family protein
MIQADWAMWATVAVRQYADHPDWDDLEQEATIAAWRAQARYPEAGEGRRRALAQGAARKAACEFIRSNRNRMRVVTRAGVRLPTFVDFSELTSDEEPGRRDFAPLLIVCLS